MRAGRPLRGPGPEGGGFAAAHLKERAAALWPGDAPREGTGPPLSVKAGRDRRATANRPAAWHMYTPSPALTLSLRRPQGQEKRAGAACPTRGAARPVTTRPAHQRTPGKRSELAFDSQEERENYTNPLTVSVHASRGLPVAGMSRRMVVSAMLALAPGCTVAAPSQQWRHSSCRHERWRRG